MYTITAGGPIKATPLMIDGVLYFSTPDHAYAVDARTGREIWHYVWPSKGGNHLGNRGMAALGDTLYFETPDCHLVALEMKTGEKKWDKEICDMNRFYYASAAPVVVKNHIIAGVSGDDMDNPGYLEGARPGDRRAEVALLHRAAEEGRPGLGHLAERRGDEARRRHDVAAGHLRSRPESDLRDHRQSAAGHRPQEPRRRQPVHRLDRRAQRRHRQDGVVLPGVAARHARLGRGTRRRC